MANAPLFGIFLDPSIGDPQSLFEVAKIADENGLDLLTVQDHPYQMRHYENWTLLTALAMKTKQIHVAANVGNLPLRPPAMLAKQAATLDNLTGGRVELGLGAGGFWDAIAAFGGEKRSPKEAYTAFNEALHIIRGLWDNASRSFSYEGSIYSVKGAKFGPQPVRRIPIWVGALGPKMLRLTGRMADGLLISMPYIPPEKLPEFNAIIDSGAQEAGRSPDAIRRGYNIGGAIQTGGGKTGYLSNGNMIGTADYWASQLTNLYTEYRQDTFIFWGGGDVAQQTEIFAKEVVPAVKAQLAKAISS